MLEAVEGNDQWNRAATDEALPARVRRLIDDRRRQAAARTQRASTPSKRYSEK
jgi:hypothetical protein